MLLQLQCKYQISYKQKDEYHYSSISDKVIFSSENKNLLRALICANYHFM